ncbi:MAG: hypothetical protein ACJ76Y_15710 [Thermoanaerobaculia bacterium]
MQGETMVDWPAKEDRQKIEFDLFRRGYRTLENGCDIDLMQWREQPDCEVRDVETGEIFGVELTSVYLNKRRVESYRKGLVKVPKRDPALIEAYQRRLLEAIREKVEKARSGYEIYPRMILAIYVGDIVAIHMDREDDWCRFHDEHREDFDNVSPFSEVVFFNLANDGVFSIKCVNEARKGG